MRAVGSGNLKSLAREEKEAEEEFNVIGPQDIDCGLAQAEDWLETSLSCSPAAEGRCDDDCEVFEAGGGWEGVEPRGAAVQMRPLHQPHARQGGGRDGRQAEVPGLPRPQ